MAALTQKQISRAKSEAEASLAGARGLREQWLAAVQHNPTGLAQKDIDHLTKAFKNRLLTVKWDCEDLEELVSGGGTGAPQAAQTEEHKEAKTFLDACKDEISSSMNQLESFEANRRIFSKHGIKTSSMQDTALADANVATATSTTTPTFNAANNPTIIQNPLHDNAQYQRLLGDTHSRPGFGVNGGQANDDDAELHFDKSQIESSATIFTNALYEHYETEDYLTKGLNASRVFNNLTRPNTESDVYAGANENEMILDMLEPEYYNPPSGLLAKAKYNATIRRLLDPNGNKFLGPLVLVLSFPILLMLIMVL